MARTIVLVTILLALSADLAAPVFALMWGQEAVYDGGMAGVDASLVISGSVPRMAYTAAGSLFVAERAAEGWTSEWIATCGVLGGWCSIAQDYHSGTGVAYIDTSGATNDLRYSHKVGNQWVTEYVDTVGLFPDYVSLAYSGGIAFIAYCCRADMSQPATVKMAERTFQGSWQSETVAQIGDVTGPSLALDSLISGNSPHISFVDVDSGLVKHAWRSQGSWSVETVDGSQASPAQYYTSLRIARDDTLAISYFGESSDTQVYLKFAKKGALSWTKERVTALPSPGVQYCSLGLDITVAPSIAYLDSASGHLVFTRKTAGGWFSETVDDAPSCGYHPSLVVNGTGNPYIGYVDLSSGSVKYAVVLAADVEATKSEPDGKLVSLENVVTSTSSADFAKMLYVQEQDRSGGIQLYFGATPPVIARGIAIQVTGVSGTRAGERCVLYPTVIQ